MSIEMLTPEEQNAIDADLPDAYAVCRRITEWPYVDMLRISTKYGQPKYPESLIVSNVCFFDARASLFNARYALGQAIAVRKYYLDRSNRKDDENAMLSDVRSRFYADYVALLLASTSEHIYSGIQHLFGLTKQARDSKGSSHQRILGVMKTSKPHNNITPVLENFVNSNIQKDVSQYRDAWVHNKPKRVESMFYNPSRQDELKVPIVIDVTTFGPQFSPDYLWKDLIELFKKAMEDTTKLLTVCADEWESQFKAICPSNSNENHISK